MRASLEEDSYAIDAGLLRLDGERRERKSDRENEPDAPHGHLGAGWLAGV